MTKNKPIMTAKRIQRTAESLLNLLKVRKDDEIVVSHIKWTDTYIGAVNNLECALNKVVAASSEEISNLYRQRRY